jgi:hypothetical protein
MREYTRIYLNISLSGEHKGVPARYAGRRSERADRRTNNLGSTGEYEESFSSTNSVGGTGSLNTNHMVDKKWRMKQKSPIKGSKTPGLLQLYWARRWHSSNALCLTTMRLLLIQLPPSTTRALFKLVMIEVSRIALCFQAGLMWSTQKETHPSQAWKTSTRLIHLLSAYMRLPPIRWLHPYHGNYLNH